MAAGSFEKFMQFYQQSLISYNNDNINISEHSNDLGTGNSSLQSNNDDDNNNSGSHPDNNDGMFGGLDFMPDEIPGSLRTLFTISYVVIMLLAVTGNAATILVIGVNREMRTVTNIFLLSLAVSDSLIALVNMPVQLTIYLRNEWTMGEAICRFSPYVQGVVIVASILTLTTLAIDRYYAICHPLRARHVHTVTRAIILASSIWAVALLLVIPQIFVQRLEPKLVFETDEATGAASSLRTAYVCVEYFESQRLAVVYTCFFYVVLYIFPVVTMVATYGTIAVRLWRRRPIGESADARRDGDRRLREKQRIVRMLVVVVFLFVVSWFPFFTLQVYLLCDEAEQRVTLHSFRVAMAFLQLIGYSNSCANPIVYCFMNDSFQTNFLKTLRCRWLKTEPTGAKRRRRSSGTEADKTNGATSTTRNTALEHSTTV